LFCLPSNANLISRLKW